MRKVLSVLTIAVVLLFAVSSMAQNRVVVTPIVSLLLTEKDCNGDRRGNA